MGAASARHGGVAAQRWHATSAGGQRWRHQLAGSTSGSYAMAAASAASLFGICLRPRCGSAPHVATSRKRGSLRKRGSRAAAASLQRRHHAGNQHRLGAWQQAA